VPVFCYLILRRVTGRLWATLLAWLIAAHSVFIYTIPDFCNQVLVLASLWAVLEAGAPRRRWLLVPAGLLCAANAAFKQNIGLAWVAAVGAVLLLRRVKAGKDPAAGAAVFPRWAALGVLAVFAAYGALVTSLFAGWDNVIYFSLPFALFWGWLFLRLGDRTLILDGSGFFGDAALFAIPFVLALGAGFTLFAWNVGFEKYFDLLFRSPLGDKGLIARGVSTRGLLYYGLNGRPALLDPHRLEMFLLWYFPAAANLLLAGRLLLSRPEDALRDRAALLLAAASITGAYMLFPLESFFNLETKLCLPLLALAAAFSARLRRPQAAPLAAVLLAAVLALPLLKNLRGDERLWAESGRRLAWVAGNAGIYMPRPLAAELERSLEPLRANVKGRFYVLGSNSADLSMYYRLLDARFPAYYTDLRQGYLNQRAERALIEALRGCPSLIVEKDDLDAWRKDPSRANRTLREALAYVDAHYDVVAAYVRSSDSGYAGLYDFYVMHRISASLKP
ncbi:MAG: hypothetical protein KGK30_02995, partial [Elusimicrobia bacterium]|nr:hypothetical protein [Elusimicrobiota bacterium]